MRERTPSRFGSYVVREEILLPFMLLGVPKCTEVRVNLYVVPFAQPSSNQVSRLLTNVFARRWIGKHVAGLKKED